MKRRKKSPISAEVATILLILTAFVSPSAAEPDFTVENICTSFSVVGGEVCYTVTISNTGEVPVLILDAHDTLHGPIFELIGLTIHQGEIWPIEYCITVPPDAPDPLINIVTVTAQEVGETDILTRESEPCETDLLKPDIIIEKTVDKTDPWYGYTVTYSIYIENNGELPLDIVVIDPLLGDILDPFVLLPDETWCDEFPYVVHEDDPCPLENCAEVICIPLGVPDLIIEEDCVEICPEPPGGEGCVPGFWKKNGDKHGASAWCDRFSPDDLFSEHFSLIEDLEIRGKGQSTITNPVLLQALRANGGGVNAMIRHGIAAMLNACSDCVNYEYSSPDEVIFMIEDTLNEAPGAYTVDELHSMFASNNEAGCSVNQHGDCVDVEDEID